MPPDRDTILYEVERAQDEIVDFAAELIRIPTVNPPGDAYYEASHFIGERLARMGFVVDYPTASDRPEHTDAHPRVNVFGLRPGTSDGPVLHLNGHMDVVPAGNGWSVDPFAGLVDGNRLYGRGACDMKAGIAAALYAAEAVQRAGASLAGDIELSATVDEESGGLAGMRFLCEQGRLSRARTNYVIIPEPLNVNRICVGHRGVYWFKVTAHGRIAHGSMPFLGESAIGSMASLLGTIHSELEPKLQTRVTATPVVPERARHATLNINAISGGQAGQHPQSPCVADRCEAIFDRRFLREEGFEQTKREVESLLQRAGAGGATYELEDLMIVEPVETPGDSPLIASLEDAIASVLGQPAERVASPGTYDHKHVARVAGVEHCVAYGPGILELAHQVDEYCDIDDLVNATKVLALAIVDLVGTSRKH